MCKEFIHNLGKNIKKHRINANLTQKNLAQIVGIHPTYVGKLEAGKNNPSLILMFKIARAMKIKLVDILDFDKT